MNNVDVEENKLKRKSIIDKWLKVKNPTANYYDQRIENFEMNGILHVDEATKTTIVEAERGTDPFDA